MQGSTPRCNWRGRPGRRRRIWAAMRTKTYHVAHKDCRPTHWGCRIEASFCVIPWISWSELFWLWLGPSLLSVVDLKLQQLCWVHLGSIVNQAGTERIVPCIREPHETVVAFNGEKSKPAKINRANQVTVSFSCFPPESWLSVRFKILKNHPLRTIDNLRWIMWLIPHLFSVSVKE